MSIGIDIIPYDFQLIEIQDDVRTFFAWNINSDIESAHQLLTSVESNDIESWSRSQRAVTLAMLRRRLVLRDTKIVVLGAAVEEEEILSMLENPTLFVAADGAVGSVVHANEGSPKLAKREGGVSALDPDCASGRWKVPGKSATAMEAWC